MARLSGTCRVRPSRPTLSRSRHAGHVLFAHSSSRADWRAQHPRCTMVIYPASEILLLGACPPCFSPGSGRRISTAREAVVLDAAPSVASSRTAPSTHWCSCRTTRPRRTARSSTGWQEWARLPSICGPNASTIPPTTAPSTPPPFERCVKEFKSQFRDALVEPLRAAGLEARVFIWTKFHDRYLLSNLVGISLPWLRHRARTYDVGSAPQGGLRRHPARIRSEQPTTETGVKFHDSVNTDVDDPLM